MGVRRTFSSDLCFLMAFSGEVEVENERPCLEGEPRFGDEVARVVGLWEAS